MDFWFVIIKQLSQNINDFHYSPDPKLMYFYARGKTLKYILLKI